MQNGYISFYRFFLRILTANVIHFSIKKDFCKKKMRIIFPINENPLHSLLFKILNVCQRKIIR